MESSTPPSYDPYAFLPFVAYRSFDRPESEFCYSLMHFVESEKFRGVDESYRQFLLKQDDRDDFLLETGAIDQGGVRQDWPQVRFALIRAGMWMQLVQHQDHLRESLLQAGCETGVPLIDQVAADIYERLMKAHEPGNELRRVVLAGDLGVVDAEIFKTFDHLFQNRMPDEIYVSDEPGVAEMVHKYALTKYIPLRVFTSAEEDCAGQMLTKGTHVFTISVEAESDSSLTNRLLQLAAEQGKVFHRFPWVT
ncbi:hypothetical protein PVE_R2G0245 [Pseudomonas veronii 1YdBTEX2]|uniref:Uncharacterized protein n=1 Tax=Pseudomonas veronii 1YdBTEX2 TaxID=1295141 RepID=A0A1D3K7E5_PSEVE|nr:hypothetical protein PVE_R2G0245 [Pseudomonas veronii 1YdBTEX2]